MKKSFLLLAIIIAVYSMLACSKQSQTADVQATDIIDTSKTAIKYSGQFSSAPGESVSGKVLILLQNGVYSIALENFNTGNGPDLRLYLSKQIQPVGFIEIGRLKSTKGNQVYALNAGIDFTQYKYALIFCQQYNVLFGSAELK
jgi:hypothetical protein